MTQAFQPQFQQGFQQQPQSAPQAAAYVPSTGPGSWDIGTAQDAAGSPVKVAHLAGRTVAIVPLKAGESPNTKNPAKPSKWIQADVFVLDGPLPFYFGGSPNGKPPVPDTMMVNQLPFFAERTILFGEVLHDQLESKIGNGVAVGRVETKVTGTGNTPWILTTDPTPEQLQLVHRLVQAQYAERNFPNPVVTMLAGPQAQQNMTYQQAPQFGQSPMGGQMAPVQAPTSPAPQWPAQQGAQFAAPAQPAAPVNFQAFMSPAAPAAPAQAADWTLTTMPPTVPAEHAQAWRDQTTLDQRLQMLAAAGINGPSPTGHAQPTGL